MTDQLNTQTSNTQTSDANNARTWTIEHREYTEDVEALGFLQLCADRRFHRVIQEEFKKDARLSEREDYWIHADAGGTPTMGDSRVAPNYCYGKKGVRLMGWSAHGDGCGGFGEEVPDDVIREALIETMRSNVELYPEATHFIYFVTVKDNETLVYRLIIQPGDFVICEPSEQ